MQKISNFFITRPTLTHLLLFLLIVAGVISALKLKRQGYPTIDFDIVKITTEYPGAGPEDVEINVTNHIEDELREVDDIDEMTSMSLENVSLIIIIINPDAKDPKRVKNDIRSAVDRVADLPHEVTKKPKVEEIRTTNMPVMEVSLSGGDSEKELRTFARSLELSLNSIEGVGLIEKLGYRKREVLIEADHDKLQDRYVSLGEVMKAIRARNIRATGGSLESYVAEKKIVTFSEYDDPMDVKNVIIRSTFSGKGVKIGDVAEVGDSFEDPDTLNRVDGRNGISLVIRPQESADIITLSEKVREHVDAFRQRLPENVQVKVMYDYATYTTNLLRVTINNGIIGLVLILLVLFLFLDAKTAFWVALGLPVAMCGALILFHPFDITINYISLIAMIMVIGILVDDAIVFAEKIFQYKDAGMEPIAATSTGLREMFWPVAVAVMTTALAFIPICFISGLMGKFAGLLPIVVVIMLLFSLFESTVFLPCHIAHTKPSPKNELREKIVTKGTTLYRRAITWCLGNRLKVVGIFFGILVAITLIAVIGLKFVIFPQVDPDIFFVVAEAPSGTSLTATGEKMAEVEKIIQDVIPEESLISMITRVGHHDTDVYGGTMGRYDNWAVIEVYQKPAHERTTISEPLFAEMQRRFDVLDAFDRITIEALDEGPPIGKPVMLIFTSTDDDLRLQFESEVRTYLEGIDGVFGVESTHVKGKNELRLMLDYEEMARLGITAFDVANTVRAAFEGEVVTSITRDNEEIDFRVSLKDSKKYREEGLLDLLITNRAGKLIPLGSFARLDERESVSVIYHYDGTPAVILTANLDTGKITSMEVNELVRKEFEPKAFEHPGLRMELSGEAEKTEKSIQSFYIALIIALLAIYVLLVVHFNSLSEPFLIMSVIPFAVLGVFLALMIHGLPLSFLALIGTLGLLGVVVNDSIVMISQLNKRCRDNGFRISVIIDGATSRLRPILLTTLTTAIGLFPTVYGLGGELPTMRPMVLAIAWGLLFTLPVSLVFVPLIYSVLVRANREL